MTAQEDHHFTAIVTWNPPVYPYKTPNLYRVKWTKEDSLQQTGLQFPVSDFCFVVHVINLIIIIFCLRRKQS